MCHQHLQGALVELEQIGKTAAGPDGVLHDPPEALDGVEEGVAKMWIRQVFHTC